MDTRTDNQDIEIEVRDLRIAYGDVAAVGPVSFSVPKGSQLTLLGPSGCGKSTTLRGIAGLEKPSAGQIRIGSDIVFSSADRVNIATERRGLSMVFQSYAIWPHMTVYDNVAYGLKVRHKGQSEIDAGVDRALELVQMSAFKSRQASQLSGGQQQRVALARACAFSPDVLLFDEPLSNLDAKLRGDMRIELRELQRRLGVTSLYVTHDLEEALAMSDLIAVMNKGRIEQIGSPTEIYNYPRTVFVADFVGSANIISGRVQPDASDGERLVIETPEGQTVHGITRGRPVRDSASLSVRTVHLSLHAQAPEGAVNTWPVTVRRLVFLGDMNEIHVDWFGHLLIVRQSTLPGVSEGQQVFLHADPDHCVLLEDEVGDAARSDAAASAPASA